MMLRAGALTCALILSASASVADCVDDRVTVFGDWGRANFTVTVADEPQERSQGLMFVERMGTLEGMLFVYDRPQRATFWMRNTLIALDMIFAASDGRITHIHHNAEPLDETTIEGGTDVSFVLEINGGMAGRLGIEEGDVLQHPSIGVDAVRPCEN